MRVLAVDSSTERESVALVEHGEIRGEVRLQQTGHHSRRLLPAIAFLLGNLDLAPADVDAYAVAVGPGSFTGLRVGISTVQGLALALRRPCLGVPTLDVLAARIRGAAPFLVALMDGGRGQVYARLYDGAARPLGDAAADVLGGVLTAVPRPAAFVGDAVARDRDEIVRVQPDAMFPERSLFLAGTLGLVAEPRLLGGEGVDAGALRPVYLREAHIRPTIA